MWGSKRNHDYFGFAYYIYAQSDTGLNPGYSCEAFCASLCRVNGQTTSFCPACDAGETIYTVLYTWRMDAYINKNARARRKLALSDTGSRKKAKRRRVTLVFVCPCCRLATRIFYTLGPLFSTEENGLSESTCLHTTCMGSI